MVTVDPERQGSGLGRALLESAEEWARANLATERMEMTVIVQRSELIDWYRRQGYQPTGERRPFPYDDPKAGTPRRDDLEFVVLEKRLR
jgi:ribosomal protein S18 acetylase RimI-like enzyme